MPLLPKTLLSNDTVLVTGGAGFIGSQVCEALLLTYPASRVVVVDNCKAHYSKQIKQKRIENLKSMFGTRFVFFGGSVTNERFVKRTFNLVKPDYLIHLAAEVGVRKGEQKQAAYFRTNVLGTTLVLDALPATVKHVVIASSSAVYGNTALPFSEDQLIGPTVPLSVYGGSKLAMESAAFQFYRKSKLPLTLIRPFSVYGPDGRPDMFPIMLAVSALKSKKITIFGNPAELKRDWTYIDDMVAGILSVLIRPNQFSIVNIGRGASISMDEVLNTARGIFLNNNIKLDIEVIVRNVIEMEKTWADISIAKSRYGYNPKTDFKYGYKKVVDFVLANRELYL